MRRLVLGFLHLCPCATIVALLASNELQAQTFVKYGDMVTGSIGTVGEIDTYFFTGAVGDLITIRMTSNKNNGAQFEVYDPDGTMLKRVWSYFQSNRLDTLRLKKSGVYVLLAMDQDGLDTFNYALYLQRIVSPAGAQTIRYGDAVAGSIPTLAAMRAYNFDGSVGEIITVRMIDHRGTGAQLEVYDPDGTMLKRVWSYFQSNRLDTLRLRKSGAYILLAMDQDGLDSLNYVLYLQRIVNPAGVQTIRYSNTVTDSVTTLAAMKAYNFAGSVGGIITVRMTSSNDGSPQFEMYDPDGTMLARVWSYATSIRLDTLRLKKNGLYTLFAMDHDGLNTIHYTLTIVRLTRAWAGAVDSSWNNPSNWFPSGIPGPMDSIVIGAGLRDPVIYVPQSEVSVGGLNLTAAAHLTVREAVPRFVVTDVATVDGSLEISASDTLFIQQAAPAALEGSGKIPRGTIQRFIPQSAAGRYRFESDSTYFRYDGAITGPTTVSITTYPDTLPLDSVFVWNSVPSKSIVGTQTVQAQSVEIGTNRRWAIKIPRGTKPASTHLAGDVFVRRAYALSVVGDTAAKVTLSLRYDLSELPAGVPAELLQICWSSGVLTGGKDGSTGLPARYALFQNYPNPFNPTTEIRFDLPSESFVSLRIYNVLGQLTKTLINALCPGGTYTERWDGTDEAGRQAAGGVYFCRLMTSSNGYERSSFTQARKMLFIK